MVAPMTPRHNPYPGHGASALELRTLADEYRRAAQLLVQLGRPGNPLSRAPLRLTAIHAIELYLNALLLNRGHAPAAIRGLQHDLLARAALAREAGLNLRLKTRAHLEALARNREYLASRYAPEQGASLSQVNRIMATLEEVARKVSGQLDAAPASAGEARISAAV
jgi:HEPN domain-containing protein